MITTPKIYDYSYAGEVRVVNAQSEYNGFGDYAEFEQLIGHTYARTDAEAKKVLTAYFRRNGGSLTWLNRVELDANGEETVTWIVKP